MKKSIQPTKDLNTKQILANPDISIIKKENIQDQILKIKDKYGYELDINMQIGFIAKQVSQDNNLFIQDKGEITHTIKLIQSDKELYPYDRYIKQGSNNRGSILDREQNSYTASSRKHIIWSVNHYLGMNRNKEVIEFSKQCIDKYGTGSGTSVASGGMNELHRKIEKFFCKFWNKEETLLFPTGYSANLGTISSLVGTKDLVLLDKECHASIIDGIKLSKANYLPFKHNNPLDLEHKLKKYSQKYKNVLVIVESAYSMSGDECPIKEIIKLKQKYKFMLYVDEAHTFGFYGENGRGYCQENNCLKDVDIIMTTLSKSTGAIGGVISCSKTLSTYIQFKANSYLFQACISPADAGAVLKALEILSTNDSPRKKLWENTTYFRNKLIKQGFELKTSKSPIIPIYIKDPLKLAKLCHDIYKNGVFTNWIAFPAVGFDEGRLRFIVSTNHNKEDIDDTCNILYNSYKKIK